MPSPFPGMDPYLEDPARWGGVHTSLVVAIYEQLNLSLPDDYVARIDEYLWVDDRKSRRRVKPDGFVPASSGGAVGTVVRPRVTRPSVEGTFPAITRKQRFIEIRTADGRRPVTVVEILSPANKAADEDGHAYRQKRRLYLPVVNFVEIDLLRAGRRMPMGSPSPPESDYCVFVCRRGNPVGTAVWAFGVRDRLPVVSMPLDPDRPDGAIDLHAAFRRVYDGGRYANDIDYSVPPEPPLPPDEAAWADKLLKSKPPRRRKLP